MSPRISVVTPAHDEAESLQVVIPGIAATLSDIDHEIIVVDDGSTDGTWEVICDLASRLPTVRGVRLARNFGHQAALLAGISCARGGGIITIDSDGQHPVELLPDLVRHWEQGSDIVQGIREDGGERWLKRRSSRMFYTVANALGGGVRVEPGSADFRLMSRRVVDQVLAASGSIIFLRGLLPWLGYPVTRVRFRARPRVAGSPSYGYGRMLRLSLDGILATSVVPLRFSIALGLAVAALSFAYMLYVTGIRIFADTAVPGWASMTGLLALLGGVQLVTVGILGEYLGRLFLSQLGRPPFVIRDLIQPSAEDRSPAAGPRAVPAAATPEPPVHDADA